MLPRSDPTDRVRELSGDFDAGADALEELGCEGLDDGVDEFVQVGCLVGAPRQIRRCAIGQVAAVWCLARAVGAW